MLTVGSLFSGIGGLDLACEMAGFKTLWQVEKNDFCRQVLHKHWPDAVQHSDLFDCHDLPYVDLLIAGFPCQPFSIAGSRKGKDDERYLIPEMFRIIRECQPRTCLFENVRGFTNIDDGNVFRDFLREVAACGYDAEWIGVRASDFGAPHERYRVFIVAYATGEGLQSAFVSRQPAHSSQTGTRVVNRPQRRSTSVAYARSAGREKRHAAAQSGGKTHPARRAAARGAQRLPQPRMGRAAHGTAAGLDSLTAFPGFPAGQGTFQYPCEPARTIGAADRDPHWKERIKALGNAVVWQQAYPIARAVYEWLQTVGA